MDYNVPEGFTVEVDGTTLKVKGGSGEQEVKFNPRILNVKSHAGKVTIMTNRKETRKNKSAVYSIVKHLENAVQGLTKPYEKKLEVVYAHFPISVEVKAGEVLIKNFLGEKMPRKAEIQGKAKVEAKGQAITVTGQSKEDVGQTASNIVRAVRITKRDVRVFQDGIYYNEG